MPRASIPGTAIVLAALLAAQTVWGPLDAYAAVTGDVDAQVEAGEEDDFDRAVVETIQKLLSELGLYTGSLDGKFDAGVDAAIRSYQGQSGLPVTGRPSVGLRDHLQRTLDVQKLTQRLKKTREKRENAARAALMAHPATRDLVAGEGEGETADPTRDTDTCFAEPTVRCLLTEAFESAKAIFKQEHRDWALGEILTAQAQAGLSEAALETTRRITDPRLVIVALREIAEGAALRGEDQDAQEGIDLIPDPQARADAWISVVRVQISQKRKAPAKESLAEVSLLLDQIESPVRRAGLLAAQARLFHELGADTETAERLKTLETILETDLNAGDRRAVIRLQAKALSETNRPVESLDVIEQLDDTNDHATVRMAAAASHARLGQLDAARETLNGIRAARYRSLALINVAKIEADRGNLEEADRLLAAAGDEVGRIRLPYAKAYSISRLALTQASLAPQTATVRTLAAAVARANEINDPRIRARTLWEIDNRIPVGLIEGDTQERAALRVAAETAANQIASIYSRVWVFGEVASDRARQGDAERAEAAFDRGFELAITVENAWTRARVLTKMATTLMDIAAPAPRSPEPEDEDAPR